MEEGPFGAGAYSCKSFDSALSFLEQQQSSIDNVFVIGGARLS